MSVIKMKVFLFFFGAFSIIYVLPLPIEDR